jgi:type I restriction enzyme S subunit
MEVRKGYKQTDIGIIPEDWEVKPLGRLVSSVEYGSSAKSDTQGQIPVLRMGNLQGSKIDWKDLVYTSNELEISKYQLRSGDVLFNRTNTIDLVGKTSIFNGERPAIFAGYLIRINFDKSLLNPRFLNYCLNAEFSKKYSSKVLSVAVGQANINGQKLKTYPIPLPPTKAEQEAIAEALSDVDALIEALEQLIVKKRLVKQGTMQELLTGKRRLAGFSGKWEVKTLEELFHFSGGFTASRDQLSSNGYCYLHYGDIHMSKKTFVDVRSEFHEIPKLNINLKRVSEVSLLNDGDVVFVDASEDDEGASRHVVIVNPDNIPFISGLHTIVAKGKTNELANSYRHYCFQTRAVKDQFRFYAVGTKVTGISKSNIAKINLPVPPLPEQQAIAKILSDMDTEISALETRREKTRLLKQGMMQELLTGKIRLV